MTPLILLVCIIGAALLLTSIKMLLDVVAAVQSTGEKLFNVINQQHALLDKIVSTEASLIHKMDEQVEEESTEDEQVVAVKGPDYSYPPAITMFRKIEAVSDLVKSKYPLLSSEIDEILLGD